LIKEVVMASESYPWDSLRQQQEMDPTLCFVLSPFAPEFAGPRQVVDDVARTFNLRCQRADDIHRSGVIHADIWDCIKRAGVIVADITGFNANVMFELGVATAIKEQFRVILIVREPVENVPFDLGPFRHIQYENTMPGSFALKDRLAEYVREALSDDSAITSLAARMGEWKRSERHFTLLVSPETLARTRPLATAHRLSEQLRAYLLAASTQHGVDLDWWIGLNTNNVHAAEAVTELMLGPWPRPQFRAAYVVQHLEPELKARALQAARRADLGSLPIVRELLDAVEASRVAEFTAGAPAGVLSEGEKYELLHNFTPRMRLRL
jgi:hypothetical protein